ncbi:MAG: hypothetical protein RIE08_06270 [Acidimicrobiales bacterium]
MNLEAPAGDGADLVARSRALLDRHWRAAGYTVPNEAVYPWQWLWDSCFHALVWNRLGRPDRAIAETRRALGAADPTGFVPHMIYEGVGPDTDFWGRPHTSSITQPPIYGHTLAELHRTGTEVPGDLVAAARAGLVHLLAHRPRHDSGLIPLVHPWESGCDDSPRWDDTLQGDWSRDAWRVRKSELVAEIVRGAGGAPLRNPHFDVAPVGFNALVAFCARELCTVAPDAELAGLADQLASSICGRWDPGAATWVDAGETETGSGRVRTLDAVLALLVDDTPGRVGSAARDLVEPDAFGSPWGPSGVHRAESSFDPVTYWRGPVWPQLGYLAWLALERLGRSAEAAVVAQGVVAGATASGFAEYWDPDTGGGLGAIPQSWSALAALFVDG